MTAAGGQVLVLGGDGFVGSAIVAALARSGEFQPVRGIRRARAGAVPFRLCDATDPGSVRRALDGVRYVVNAVFGGDATLRAATRAVCDAQAGLERVVHLSTMSVYGEVSGLVDERAVLAVDAGGYAGSKVACEAIVQTYVAGGGAAVILRPGVVMGAGGQQWAGRLCRLLRARRLGDLGEAGDGFCNLIDARDVGAATVAALRAPEAVGSAINLGTPGPPRWNEVLVRLGRAIGAVPVPRIGRRRLAMEARLAVPLHVGKLVATRCGLAVGTLPEPIPPALLRLFAQQIRLDAGRASAVLAFERTSVDVTLADCARWFLESTPK
jgi:nucleoside-diphosphate-sugar epimerase